MVAILAYGLHNTFTKIAACHISDSLYAFLLEITASLCIILYIFFLIASNEKFSFTSRSVIFSIFASICVGVCTVFYIYIFSHSGELSIVGPLVMSGGVLLGDVAGIVFFKESVSFVKVRGSLVLSWYLDA